MDDFPPSFSLMHECFLLFLLSINPLNCDLVRNAVCRQTAQIDFPEVDWPNDECIGKQHTLDYLLFYIKLVGFFHEYPNIYYNSLKQKLRVTFNMHCWYGSCSCIVASALVRDVLRTFKILPKWENVSFSLEGLIRLSAVENSILILNVLIYYFGILKIFTDVFTSR